MTGYVHRNVTLNDVRRDVVFMIEAGKMVLG
jgi:hypothetical protein